MYHDKKTILTKSLLITLTAILIFLASSFFVSPKNHSQMEPDPASLLSNSISRERYISADELAHKIITGDPSLRIIDIRDSERFYSYSIPGAVNIPLNKVLERDNRDFLNRNEYDIVLYSDDNFYADQAWILCNRIGLRNLRVLDGGMHSWFNTIINPPNPEEKSPKIEHEKYSFRKSASMYFGVAYPDAVKARPTEPKPKPKTVAPVKKKKKKMPEGGC